MRPLLILLFPMLLAAANPWVSLFDGTTMTGWLREGDANFRVERGEVCVDKGNYSWLRTDEIFADYELQLEFKTSADGNSGIFLRSAAKGMPHVTGYEVQIFDTHPEFPTGSIVGLFKGQAAKLIPNVWNRYEFSHKGQQLTIKLNGKQVVDIKDARSKSGHIGLQFNPIKPICFRNMQVRRL